MEIDDDFPSLKSDVLELLSKDDPKCAELSKSIAKDIESNKLTILELIQKLGCLLLNQAFAKREVGVLLLSETLSQLKEGSLTEEQLSVISSYICEKLKDHHQVAATALRGVLPLIKCPNTSSQATISLLSTIFNHISCQQQQQQDRHLIFEIIENALKTHPAAIDSMGIDFVYSLISAIDGERDPNNLTYLFKWLQIYLKELKLGHLTEEMFEVLSCYFPVDFKAPSDKKQITREVLAEGLCECLTSIAGFGQFGIPLALEKLDSTLKIAKEDSLDILRHGCQIYSTDVYNQYCVEIWSAIQKEVFSSSDSSLKAKCCDTLKSVVAKLSTGDRKNFETTIANIAETLRGNLLPGSRLFSDSFQILIHVARASEGSAQCVAAKTAPFLENTFKITNNPKEKAEILAVFMQIVVAVLETCPNVKVGDFEAISSAPSLCSQAIVAESAPQLSLEGYKGFTAMLPHILPEIRHKYFEALQQVSTVALPKEVRLAVLQSLERSARLFPEEVELFIVKKDPLSDLVTLDHYLECLKYLWRIPHFQRAAADSYVFYAIRDVPSSSVALKHLEEIVRNAANGTGEVLIEQQFVGQLLEFLANVTSVPEEYLYSLNTVVQSLVAMLDAVQQKALYLELARKQFKCESLYLAALSGVIVPLHQGLFDDPEKFQYLLRCGLTSGDKWARNAPVQMIASILNKAESDTYLNYLTLALETNTSSRRAKVKLISWVTKGLIVRNHPTAYYWIDMMFDCLEENKEAAQDFELIMLDRDGVISADKHCRIMPLFKQKFFIYCANKLQDSEPHLEVLGYLIRSTPKQALIGQLQKIFRLILLSLETCRNAAILEIILQKVSEFISDKELVIGDHLEDLLTRILTLTTFESSMVIRIAAVKCLAQVATAYQVFQLLPFKRRVIERLGACVDDKKRLVRREAMECRSLWYLLDAPL